MFWSKIIQRMRGIFSFSSFEKYFLYLWIIVIPLMIYIIEINGKIIEIRKIREISFYSFAVIICSFLQKSRWLRYFIIWCVLNWWLNFFFPSIAYIGLTNIFSALAIYVGTKYLLEKNIFKVDILLRIICGVILFQFGWLIMQMFNFDPIFYPVTSTGAPLAVRMPLISWQGNPSMLGIFFASTAFLLLHYFKIKKIPILFFVILSSIFILKNATAGICFAGAGLFYIFNRYHFKMKYILISLLILVGLFAFFVYIKAPNMDRLYVWKRLFSDGIKLRPFVGKGINFFSHLHIVDKTGTPWDKAHNDYLQMILELGIIGFGLFSGFIISRFVMFYKQRRDTLQICIMSCIVAYLISALSLFPMHLAAHSFYAIILLCCLEKSYEIKILQS